jgi:hypothetical protein
MISLKNKKKYNILNGNRQNGEVVFENVKVAVEYCFIDYIKSKGIDVIQSFKPTFPGYLNINYQTLSKYIGLEYIKIKSLFEKT